MAGNDSQKQLLSLIRDFASQKQLLSLIRDFASEKTHGEKRIYSSKKRIEELQSELGAANAELEQAKVEKESTEQDLKGYEVELAMNETSIQALEARNVAVQDEISVFGSDLEALKNEGGANRDELIKKMLEFNASIRKFQESVLSLPNEDCTKAIFSTGISKTTYTNETEVGRRELENELGQVISQNNLVEQECLNEQNAYKLVRQELIDLEAKASIMEKILQGNAELKELTLMPKGFTDASRHLQYEATLDKTLTDSNLAPGDLFTVVQKGLQYIEMEPNLSNVDTVEDGDLSHLEHVKDLRHITREGNNEASTKGKEKVVEDGEGNVMQRKRLAHNVPPSWLVRDRQARDEQGRRECEMEASPSNVSLYKLSMSKVVIWPDLSADILADIANRLPVEDFMAFRGACTSWRGAGSRKKFVSKVPFLMIVENNDSNVRFYSLSKRKICTRKSLPMVQGKRCTDVGFGWIMALASSGEVILLNPFSSEKIDVPSYTTFPGYDGEFIESDNRQGIHIIARGVLTADPSETSSFTLILVIVGRGLGLWRKGDTGWTRINSKSQNILYRRGKVYSFSWTKRGVEVWDIESSEFSNPLDILQAGYRIPENNRLWEPYLVESTASEILLILKENEGWLDVDEVQTFQVVRIDLVRRTFERIFDLGGVAIFIGDNAAVSVDATESGGVLQPNCIYFTDDRDCYYEFDDRIVGSGMDMGLFSMSRGNIQKFTIQCRNGEEEDFTIHQRFPWGAITPRNGEGSRDSNLTCPPIWMFPHISEEPEEEQEEEGPTTI